MNSQTREININTTVPSTLSKVLLATRDYLAGSLAGKFLACPFQLKSKAKN